MPLRPADTRVGPPCKRGHTTRYISSGGCVECTKAAAKASRLMAAKRKAAAAPLPPDSVLFR